LRTRTTTHRSGKRSHAGEPHAAAALHRTR
jgi:hypothetical protein